MMSRSIFDEVRDFGPGDTSDDVVREHVVEILELDGDGLRWLGWRRGTAQEFATWMLAEGGSVAVPGCRAAACSGHLLDALRDDAKDFGRRLRSLVSAARRQLEAGYDPARHQHHVLAANSNLEPDGEPPFLYLTWDVNALSAGARARWSAGMKEKVA